MLGTVGANVATLIFACTAMRESEFVVRHALGIFTNSLGDEPRLAEFPSERYLTFRLSMDNEALAGEQGVPDDRQIAARRALAYEAFAGRLREEPGATHVTLGDRLPTMSPEWVAVELEQGGISRTARWPPELIGMQRCDEELKALEECSTESVEFVGVAA